MYKYMLLLFLSLGIHSHFVPLKITTSPSPHNISTLVREIIGLLNKTQENSRENFTTPTNITCPTCSHKYTNEFIRELHKIKHDQHVLGVERDMEVLKEDCPFLKKAPHNHLPCESTKRDFGTFKEDLKKFVSWIYERNICNKAQQMDKVDTCLQNITVLP
ncbi:uncharacterized protein ACDP82_010114 [Pangshura tecta]